MRCGYHSVDIFHQWSYTPSASNERKTFCAERPMHTLPFQNRFALVSVSFSVALAILLGAFPPAICAQDVPRYHVDPLWPLELPNNWIIGQVGGLAVDRQDHIWVLQRPASNTVDELGASLTPPGSMCCVELHGAFAGGTRGTTQIPGQEPLNWLIRGVTPPNAATIDIQLEGATLSFGWTNQADTTSPTTGRQCYGLSFAGEVYLHGKPCRRNKLATAMANAHSG